MSSNGKTPARPSAQGLWGGRFSEPVDTFVQRFTASVDFDRALYRQDIQGSIAHAQMLGKVGVLSEADVAKIVDGLNSISEEIEQGLFEWSVALEDVHLNIEARLTELIGDAGKRLHTARSRNDQVATDIRLFVRERLLELDVAITELLTVLLALAEREADTIMPGHTHLQAAQPVTFGHHVLAWFEMLFRDRDRLRDCRRRLNQLPLGAAALAGTSFPIDRHFTAALLGFDQPCENSLDAVSDRDFAIECASACAQLMVHFSRWSEELVLWTSAPFDFVRLPDRFCTGSSIMPQKKNPDVAELIRGKSARVVGALNALLLLMKGQPLAYNKDNQEDKEPLFDCLRTVSDCVRAFLDMLPHLEPRRERMRSVAQLGYLTATDLADYLVRKGRPFRDAHERVGRAVAAAQGKSVALDQLTLQELQGFDERIESDIFSVLSLDGSVAARNHFGGTAPAQVRQAIQRGRDRL